jgi:hypothetical protein
MNACQSRRAKFKGGTVIAEDVVSLQEHRKRHSDPDGYRPETCGNCGHWVLHVHGYSELHPLGLLSLAMVRVIRFICVNEDCKATWRVLPGFLARHLRWAWRPIEQATMDLSAAQRPVGGVDAVSPPAQTVRRWLGRLASSARQAVVLLCSRGAETLQAVGAAVGQNATRQELVEVYRDIVAVPHGHRLGAVAARWSQVVGERRRASDRKLLEGPPDHPETTATSAKSDRKRRADGRQARMVQPTDSDPIARLRTTGSILPDSLRDEIRSMGESAVPALIAIIQDDDAHDEDAPGEGWSPIHAVELLVDLKAEAAIEPLLQVFADTDFESIIHDRIAVRLPSFGKAALEPVLRWLGDDPDKELFSDLCHLASELGVQDERIFQHLCALMETDEGMGAMCFANFGDERALPLLRTHIEAFQPNWGSEFGMMDLNELTAAYEEVAGSMPDDLAERVGALEAKWNARRGRRSSGVPGKAGPKVGRNDPCPCGSGKKHKRCCL